MVTIIPTTIFHFSHFIPEPFKATINTLQILHVCSVSIIQPFLFILSTYVKILYKFSSRNIISCFIKDSFSSLTGTWNSTAELLQLCNLGTSLLIPPSISSWTWHLPAHFFFNFKCLLHLSPWSQTHFLPCHTYNNTHLCLVSPLPDCSSQVKQKSPTFAEDCSSNPSPTTREAIHLPANWCYSVENITHTISNKSI